MNLLKILPLLMAIFCIPAAYAEELVILHTNDTHSLIDPDTDGRGGVLQRKAIIDSVRQADRNVLLIDAGDMVQGSLYYKFFRGDVEYPLMNMTGYDIRILGNHEFDNGLDELAKHYKDVKATALSANYDFSETPLKGMFRPYIIKKIGGKKIGFIGLNVDPDGLIAKENTGKMQWSGIVETANRLADRLREKEHCDLIVAVTHIGYNDITGERETDSDLARHSRNIDIIIGGHSHTLIDPANPGKHPCLIKNADGRDVLVTQTGKFGKYLGCIKIDLDKIGRSATDTPAVYSLIPVTDRFPKEKLDRRMSDFIRPYAHVVDSVNSVPIGVSIMDMEAGESNGAFGNWTADFGLQCGQELLDTLRCGSTSTELPGKLDFAIMNEGGIRRDMRKGYVSEGQILSTFPFSNRIVLASIKGSDLKDALHSAAIKGGEAVSGNIRVAVNPDKSLRSALVNGKEIDPDRIYHFATIDYLAAGNDGLKSLANATVFHRDSVEMSTRILAFIRRLTSLGLPIAADTTPRFTEAVDIR